EGIGEDILPKNVDFSVIDYFEKVSDKDGAVMARRLAKEEGILLGYSCGSAMAGLIQMQDKLKPEDLVVVIFHDHGSRYVAKIYNDDWMRERGFMDAELKVEDLINMKTDKEFFTVQSSDSVRNVLDIMRDKDISQLPVMDNGGMVGSIAEATILSFILENPLKNSEKPVAEIMQEAFPVVSMDTSFSDLGRYITKKVPAVVSKDKTGSLHIITNYDIIQAV
ncbi:MAG: pyridoxal-phosphate dependent enzyme, partial [Bacteroidota bacterium]